VSRSKKVSKSGRLGRRLTGFFVNAPHLGPVLPTMLPTWDLRLVRE
jgi:hypothetical protein